MTDTLFNAEPTHDADAIDPNKDYFAELVGEGKKFKTEADLARSKVESDRFINQLTAEHAGLRKELEARVSMEKLVEELKAASAVPSLKTNIEEQNLDRGEDDASKRGAALTAEDIERIVAERLAQASNQGNQNRNMQMVRDKLIEQFGSGFAVHLERIASDLGVSKEYLDGIAKENPGVFLKLTGVGTKTADGFTAPPASAVTAGFTPQGGQKDWNYYENIRKTNPTAYWSPSVQNELFRQATKLGDKFRT